MAAAITLYDQKSGKSRDRIADDLSAEDVRGFCDAHAVTFYAMGTPPGIDDPDGLGWNDTTRIRVSHPVGGGAQAGTTLHLDVVRRWKLASLDLDPEMQGNYETLLQAADLAGDEAGSLKTSIIEQSLRLACSMMGDHERRMFAASGPVDITSSRIHTRWANRDPLANAIAGARMQHDAEFVDEDLAILLRSALLSLHPQRRPVFFAHPEIAGRIAVLETRNDTAPTR